MSFTEKRKADRTKMADKLEAAMIELGATVERPDPLGDREVRLKISVPFGAYIGVDFDGDSSQPDVHVATWNTESDCLFAFSSAMGSVNEVHFSKATRVAYGFDALLSVLSRDVAMLIDGRGYCSTRAAKIAGDRRKRFESSREYTAALVAAGKGTVFQDGSECESAEKVREAHERYPMLISQIDAFTAAGCPMSGCSGFPWH